MTKKLSQLLIQHGVDPAEFEARQQAFNNRGYDLYSLSYSKWVADAFVWRDSPEGYDFWRTISNEWKEICQDFHVDEKVFMDWLRDEENIPVEKLDMDLKDLEPRQWVAGALTWSEGRFGLDYEDWVEINNKWKQKCLDLL